MTDEELIFDAVDRYIKRLTDQERVDELFMLLNTHIKENLTETEQAHFVTYSEWM